LLGNRLFHKVKPTSDLPLITVPGFFVLENGIFIRYPFSLLQTSLDKTDRNETSVD